MLNLLNIFLLAASWKGILIQLIVLLVVIAIVWTIIALLPVGPLFKNICKIILLAAILIWLLLYSGWM